MGGYGIQTSAFGDAAASLLDLWTSPPRCSTAVFVMPHPSPIKASGNDMTRANTPHECGLGRSCDIADAIGCVGRGVLLHVPARSADTAGPATYALRPMHRGAIALQCRFSNGELSLPWPVRPLFAAHPGLLTWVLAVVTRSLRKLSLMARTEGRNDLVGILQTHRDAGRRGSRNIQQRMIDHRPQSNLGDLLDDLEKAGDMSGKVSIAMLIEAVGRRSFGPLLLLAGLIAASPLSGIPGMPTTVAVLVAVVAVQFLLGRDHFWLPQWLLRRTISRDKFCKGLRLLRRPARFVDRLLRPRLQFMTHHAGIYAIAILCIVIAAAMPPLELVPFAATVAGVALTAFGLALIANDGLVGLVAIVATVAVAGFVGYAFL